MVCWSSKRRLGKVETPSGVNSCTKFRSIPGLLIWVGQRAWGLRSKGKVSVARVGLPWWPQKWSVLAAKRLREHGTAEEMWPELDEGHLMMNWEVTGSMYLDRRTWAIDGGIREKDLYNERISSAKVTTLRSESFGWHQGSTLPTIHILVCHLR